MNNSSAYTNINSMLNLLNKLVLRRLQNNNETSFTLKENQIKSIDRFKQKLECNLYKFEEISCLCGRSNDILLGNTDRYTIPVTTLLCKNCGIMRTSPRLSRESLIRFYADDYRPIYVGSKKANSAFFNNQINHGKFIFRYLQNDCDLNKDTVVFDIGCGAGGTLVPFKDYGCKTFGCDYGINYLEYGRSNGLTLENGNYIELEKHGKANIIILSHVLEHLENPLEDLKKIHEFLCADDCLVYIELPGIFHIHRSYMELLFFFQNAHLFHFTLKTLNWIMQKSGYSPVKGDQFIHALYKKNKSYNNTIDNTLYFKIIIYFYFLEFARMSKFQDLARKVLAIYRKLSKNT